MAPPPVRNLPIPVPPPTTPDTAPPAEPKPRELQRLDAFVRAPTKSSFDGAAAFALAGLQAPDNASSIGAQGLVIGQVDLRVGRTPIVLGRDGRLGLGALPRYEGEEVAALVAFTREARGPFLQAPLLSAVSNEDALRALADRAAQIHLYASRAASGSLSTDLQQVRASALTVLIEATLRAQALGQTALATTLTATLSARLDAEPNVKMREFYDQKFLAAFKAGLAPAFAARAKLMDESAPPYEKWKAAGVIRVHYVVDDNGTPRTSAEEFFKDSGFSRQPNADGSITYRRPARVPGGLPIEVVFRPTKPGDAPEIFSRMDDDKVGLVVYSGHAGHGQNVRDALGKGVKGDGSGKVLVLYQCSGIYNTDEIKTAFPRLQFTSTTEMTDDGIDMPMFQEMLDGFQHAQDWTAIGDRVKKRMLSARPGTDLSKHYFFPATQASELERDRDNDGLADAHDRLFDVTSDDEGRYGQTPVFAPSSESPIGRSAKTLPEATANLALILRNEHILSPAQEALAGWSAGEVVADGVFVPDPGETNAFRFTFDAAKKRLSVRMSSAWLQLDGRAASQMLVLEAARDFAARAHVDAAGATSLALLMSERLHEATKTRYAEPDNNRRYVFQRYGLDPNAADALIKGVGAPEDLPTTALADMTAKLGSMRLGDARDVGRELTLPAPGQVRFTAGGDMATLAKALGLSGEIINRDDGYLWRHDGVLETLQLEALGDLITRARVMPGPPATAETWFPNTFAVLNDAQKKILTAAWQTRWQAGVAVADIVREVGLVALDLFAEATPATPNQSILYEVENQLQAAGWSSNVCGWLTWLDPAVRALPLKDRAEWRRRILAQKTLDTAGASDALCKTLVALVAATPRATRTELAKGKELTSLILDPHTGHVAATDALRSLGVSREDALRKLLDGTQTITAADWRVVQPGDAFLTNLRRLFTRMKVTHNTWWLHEYLRSPLFSDDERAQLQKLYG